MTEAAIAIVGSTLLAIAAGTGGAFLLKKWSQAKPCFGDHDFTNYSHIGDYRIVAAPTRRILPQHRVTCQYYQKYRAECSRDDCFQHDIEWRMEGETDVELNSLEDLGNVIIEEYEG